LVQKLFNCFVCIDSYVKSRFVYLFEYLFANLMRK